MGYFCSYRGASGSLSIFTIPVCSSQIAINWRWSRLATELFHRAENSCPAASSKTASGPYYLLASPILYPPSLSSLSPFLSHSLSQFKYLSVTIICNHFPPNSSSQTLNSVVSLEHLALVLRAARLLTHSRTVGSRETSTTHPTWSRPLLLTTLSCFLPGQSSSHISFLFLWWNPSLSILKVLSASKLHFSCGIQNMFGD